MAQRCRLRYFPSIILLAVLTASCATAAAVPDASPVDEARLVVESHERFARAGDLDAIMSNIADDIVMLVPNMPLVQGRVAFREYYASLLKTGRFDFAHMYAGAATAGDTVVLHGTARGTFTPNGAAPDRFMNNFILVLQKQADGKYRFLRIASASS